jgi:tetratricopeptide (TPR) repeat protein/SAM-dependent methyltransferase
VTFKAKAIGRSALASLARAVVPHMGRRLAAVMRAGSRGFGVSDHADRVLVREADRRHRAGDRDGARAILEVTARRAPTAASAALSVVKSLRLTGDAVAAATTAREILVRPELPHHLRSRALAELALAEEQAGDLSAAIEHLTEAVDDNPDQAGWCRTLAGWHYRVGRAEEEATRWDAAAAAYRSAIDLDDSKAWWRYRLGHVLDKAGRWYPAVSALEEAVARDSSHPTWSERLARTILKAPEWSLARLPAEQSGGSLSGGPAHGVVAPPAEGVVAGWIPAPASGGDRVVFKFNGVEVADTRATRATTAADGRRLLEFRRNVRDLWSYGGSGDTLEVTHADNPIFIVDRGYRYSFTGDSRAGELLAMVGNGYVLNKYGRIRESIRTDEEWQLSMFQLYFQLQKEIEAGLGLRLFPFYGTMLGAVREHDFIGHDNDFDTVYISEHSSPAGVRNEFKKLCAHLIDRGYSLRVKKTHTWVKVPGTSHKLDIFFSWFDEDGFFQTSYGYHGRAVRKSEAFYEFRTERLGNWEIPVPRNAEEILAQLYGDSWREPDPGFTHSAHSRVLSGGYLLGIEEANEAHWRQFYSRHKIEGASSFAAFVADRSPAAGKLLDVGCGSGRDSIYLAGRGYSVTGADRSAEAVARAQSASREWGVKNARFSVLDVSSSHDLDRFLISELVGEDPAAASDGILVYLRFFLHSVDEGTEDTLLSGLVEHLTVSLRLCAEFRTTRDARLPKLYGDHYRRYIDERRLASKLESRWGFTIEHIETGQGLSPYGGEDPHLARIIALRSGAGGGA